MQSGLQSTQPDPHNRFLNAQTKPGADLKPPPWALKEQEIGKVAPSGDDESQASDRQAEHLQAQLDDLLSNTNKAFTNQATDNAAMATRLDDMSANNALQAKYQAETNERLEDNQNRIANDISGFLASLRNGFSMPIEYGSSHTTSSSPSGSNTGGKERAQSAADPDPNHNKDDAAGEDTDKAKSSSNDESSSPTDVFSRRIPIEPDSIPVEPDSSVFVNGSKSRFVSRTATSDESSGNGQSKPNSGREPINNAIEETATRLALESSARIAMLIEEKNAQADDARREKQELRDLLAKTLEEKASQARRDKAELQHEMKTSLGEVFDNMKKLEDENRAIHRNNEAYRQQLENSINSLEKNRTHHPDQHQRVPKELSYGLSSAESNSLKSKLEPEKIDEWLDRFYNILSTKHHTIADFLSWAPNHRMEAIEDPDYEELGRALDSFLARAFYSCLDHDSPRVQRFQLHVMDRLSPTQRTSGTVLITLLQADFNVPKTAEEIMAVSRRYQDTNYFKVSMEKDAVFVAASHLLRDYRAIPTRQTHSLAEHFALLQKVPRGEEGSSASKRVKELHEKLVDSEYQGTICYTLDVLIAHIARILLPRPNSFNFMPGLSAHATELPCLHHADCSHHAQPCDEEACPAELQDIELRHELEAEANSDICWGCGKDVPAAHPKGYGKCTTKCKDCKYDFCPGNRGMTCPCTKPGSVRNTENAAGRKLPARCISMLEKKQAEILKLSPTPRDRIPSKRPNANEATILDGFSLELIHPDIQTEILGGEVASQKGNTEHERTVAEFIEKIDAAVPRKKQDMACSTEEDSLPHLEADLAEPMPGAKDGVSGLWMNCMIDRGANCTISTIPGITRYATNVRYTDAQIGGQGIGQSTTSNSVFSLTATLPSGFKFDIENVYDSPGSRKMLMNEMYLWKAHKMKVDEETIDGITTWYMYLPNGDREKLYQQLPDERLWMRFFVPVENPDIPNVHPETSFDQPPGANECALEAAKIDDDDLDLATIEANNTTLASRDAMVLAARFGVGADGLKHVLEDVHGIPIKSLTTEQKKLIDSDRYRLSSIMKRAPAGKQSSSDVHEPGASIQFDGFGPHSVPDVIDGSTYVLHGVDSGSGLGFAKGTIEHTREVWHNFTAKTVTKLRQYGNKVFEVRYDRAGEFTSPEFKEAIENDLRVNVTYAASKYHEGVCRVERDNDIVTRLAECMVTRANLGPRYFIAAFCWSRILLNFRRRKSKQQQASNTMSRLEAATEKKPSVAKVPIFIFGTEVLVLRERSDRGPHGSLENGRSYVGKFLGLTADMNSLIIEKLDTGVITYPRTAVPLNEHELARKGLDKFSLTDGTTQTKTDGVHFPPMMIEQTVTSPTIKKIQPDPYPTGTRIEVRVLDENDKSTWYGARVAATRPMSTPGRFEYKLHWDMPGYENDPKWTGWIDLHRADSWHHRLEKKKVDTVATSQRKAAAPKSEGTNDAIASALLPDIATGATMRIIIVFGGESETIDNIKQRVQKRYPNATVDIIDAKDDPTGMDITLRSVRKDILTRLKTDYDVAFFCLPCTTFTPRSGRQYRGKSEGTKSAE